MNLAWYSRLLRVSLLILSVAMVSACTGQGVRDCKLRYDGWGISGGFYPPRPEGEGRLEKPWIYEVALAGSQNEAGGHLASEFKLFKLVIVKPGGARLLVTDCIQIRARNVGVETLWGDGDHTGDTKDLPTRLVLKFIDKDSGQEIKTVSYPLPTDG